MQDLVVAVECLFCWYWVADLCQANGITFVLGHALYIKAIHGGKTKNGRIDSYKIASLLRGGTLSHAYVYPREMRPTRDLMRRRLFFARKRGELFAHIQNTNTQYNLPPLEQRVRKTKDRGAVIEHFEEETVQMSVAVDVNPGNRERTPIQDHHVFAPRPRCSYRDCQCILQECHKGSERSWRPIRGAGKRVTHRAGKDPTEKASRPNLY
jgi:hypothetical protein